MERGGAGCVSSGGDRDQYVLIRTFCRHGESKSCPTRGHACRMNEDTTRLQSSAKLRRCSRLEMPKLRTLTLLLALRHVDVNTHPSHDHTNDPFATQQTHFIEEHSLPLCYAVVITSAIFFTREICSQN